MAKDIEDMLYDLPTLEIRLEDLKEKYALLQEQVKEGTPMGVPTDKDKIDSNNPSYSTTENLALRLATAGMAVKAVECRINTIRRALSLLDEKELQVIEMRYFKVRPLSWVELSMKIQYSDRQAQRIRNNALKKLKHWLTDKIA